MIKSPHPREFALPSKAKKNANARGSVRGWGGGGAGQLDLTSAYESCPGCTFYSLNKSDAEWIASVETPLYVWRVENAIAGLL